MTKRIGRKTNFYMKKMMIRVQVICFLLSLFSCKLNKDENAYEADIIIYGGTPAAVIAAVQAIKMGKSVIIVSPDKHLGGLSSGGLGFTDTGNKAAIGGLPPASPPPPCRATGTPAAR